MNLHLYLQGHFFTRAKGKVLVYIDETGAQWIRNLLFQYITDPLRATGIIYSTNDNTIEGLSNSGAKSQVTFFSRSVQGLKKIKIDSLWPL